MKPTRNMKAISKLLFILLLLTALIVGAILSYLWVIGYYVSLDRVYPEDITVNITDYAFDYQNTSYFNVTIQCPTSYKSEEPANMTRITVSTEDGYLHEVNNTDPPLPYEFQHKGESQTFKCLWNWANYTGETIRIMAFVADGSGPTFEAKTPLVDLRITDVRFNSTISVTNFNMTIRNYNVSVTYVNITEITVATETLKSENVTPPLPQELDPDSSVTLKCSWNWTNYQNMNVTVAVRTLQGYMNSTTQATPLPVTLEITDVLFDITDTTPYFNVTVQNSEASPTYVDVTGIEATAENGVPLEVTEITPSLPYGLSSGESQVFMCFCNWTGYRDENVTISVHTRQGFTEYRTKVTPAPVMLEITAVQFSPVNATRLNITVSNSRISLMDVNITHITVSVEGGTPENVTEIIPSLPYLLHINESKTFACTWNWIAYGGMNATFTVYAVGYSASVTKLVPEPIIVITDVAFHPVDPTHFNVTVKNPPLSLMAANVTNITVTVEDGTPENITETSPPLPYDFSDTEVTFKCSWNWTDHLGNKTIVTVTTLPGYVTSYTQSIPVIALINITSVVFGNDTSPYFNVTIFNPQSSLTYAHLIEITVTLQNGTVQSVDVGPPYLPHILHRNQTVTFMCLWDWTAHSGQTVVIKAKTLEGYEAPYTITVP